MFFRYLHEQRDALACHFAKVLSFGNDVTALGEDPHQVLKNDVVSQGYSTSATNIHDRAKKYHHDAEYEDEPLALRELMFILPPNHIGTNVAFNEGMLCRLI